MRGRRIRPHAAPRVISRPLPWRRPAREPLLLTLVAFAVLSQVYVVNVQDVSHYCLSRAMAAGQLRIDACGGDSIDRAEYNGHAYSNKAPGMSLLAVPA